MLNLIVAILTLTATLATPVPAYVTAYSCEAHPDNAMSGCSVTRSGALVDESVAACPLADVEAGAVYYVEGVGIVTCGDTLRHEYLTIDNLTLMHIDIYRDSYDAAVTMGIQDMTVWRLR